MYTFFVDETAIDDLCPFFVLSILCVKDTYLPKLGNDIKKIKNKYSIPPHIEIKWNNSQTNRKMKKMGLSLDTGVLNDIKSEILSIITNGDPDEIFFYWYMSPKLFYQGNKLRSYEFGINDVFEEMKSYVEKKDTMGIVLIDELSGLGTNLNRSKIREFMEGYVNQLMIDDKNSSLPIILTNINSNMSHGHQVNDILGGVFSYYLISIHNENTAMNPVIIKKIKKLIPNIKNASSGKIIGNGIMIYPLNPHRIDLQKLIIDTKNSIKGDFGIA